MDVQGFWIPLDSVRSPASRHSRSQRTIAALRTQNEKLRHKYDEAADVKKDE